MKIVSDIDIPFLRGVLEPYAEVLYKKGKDITREDLLDADAVITRTRTRCDEAMLSGTSVKAVASATIGMDHIDLPWCEAHGIEVHNAPGCNAGGVMEYVFSALYGIAARKGLNLSGMTLGIVGVGHVGSKVEAMAEYLGFRVLRCDPPRAAAEGGTGVGCTDAGCTDAGCTDAGCTDTGCTDAGCTDADGFPTFVPLEQLLSEADIVTLHVPLQDDTRGMANEKFFAAMKPGAIFINAARGEVVVDEDLLEYIDKFSAVVIDTWNNEPDINTELMEKVDIATPHIAGYSFQGKMNGTASVVRFLARKFGWEALKDFYPVPDEAGHDAVKLDLTGMSQGQIASILQYNYPIFTDDFMFRMDPKGFERLRNSYQYRREIYF